MIFFGRRSSKQQIRALLARMEMVENAIRSLEITLQELSAITKQYPYKRIFAHLDSAVETKIAVLKEGYERAYKRGNAEIWIKKEKEKNERNKH